MAESRYFDSNGGPLFKYPDHIFRKFSICTSIRQEIDKIFYDYKEEEWEILKEKVISDHIGLAAPPLFFNMESFQIDFDLIEYIKRTSDDAYVFDETTPLIEKTFSRFLGYHICVPESYVESSWQGHWLQKLDRSLKLHSEQFSNPSDSDQPIGGRPRKQEAVVDCYKTLFPNGRGDLSWKGVLREIEQKFGLNASVDTLKRGLRQKD